MNLPNHHNNTEMFVFLTDTVKDVNSYGGGRKLSYSASPIAANGYFILGDIAYNSAPTIGQPIGWMCTASGPPGTWVPLANL